MIQCKLTCNLILVSEPNWSSVLEVLLSLDCDLFDEFKRIESTVLVMLKEDRTFLALY